MGKQSEQPAHRGRWQAQGDDVDRRIRGGVSTSWNQELAPTKAEGIDHLNQLASQCQASELELREIALRKAQRHVRRAPPEGYEAEAKNKPFYVFPKHKRYPNARIDLDITAGRAFTGQTI